MSDDKKKKKIKADNVKRRRLNTMMRPDVYKKLYDVAFDEGRTVPDLLEEIVLDWVKRNKK